MAKLGRTTAARPVPYRVWPWFALVAEALAIWFSVSSFLEGRFLAGKLTRGPDRDWDDFGAGAFAADSAVYILIAGSVVALLLPTVLLGLGDRGARHRGLIPRISIPIVAVSAVASLALLIYYWASEVPFRNFQSEQTQPLLYALTCLIPLIALFGCVHIAYRYRKLGLPMALIVRRATVDPRDD